jgi:molybdopterin converting factor small subunit
MKIKVYAPEFCDHRALDNTNTMELPEAATLNDVYIKLKIPLILRGILIGTVNYKQEKRSQVLKENDVVSFIGPMRGG